MKKVWVCVYRDTIEEHSDKYNLSEILVTEDFVKQYFKDCVIEYYDEDEDIDFDTWYYDEYTADETVDFYQYAKERNAILEIKHW